MIGPYSAADLILYTTGLLITVLLLVLTLRAAKLPGTPLANIVFALCALLWSAGGLARAVLTASGTAAESQQLLLAQAIQFTGAIAFPIPILAIWRPFAARKTAARILRIVSLGMAVAIVIPFWSSALVGAPRFSIQNLIHLTATNAMLFLVAGAIACLRRASTPRAVYYPSLALVAAVSAAAVTMTAAAHSRPNTHLETEFYFLGAHLTLLVVLCSFLLFARFRFADLFIRHGVRIVLAGVWAALLVQTTQLPVLWHIARSSSSPWTIHILLLVAVSNLMLLSFLFVDSRVSLWINRWMFHAPDYRNQTRQLAEKLRTLDSESEILAATAEAARVPLELDDAQVLPSGKGWPAAVLEGEVVESPPPESEVLIPIAPAGRVTHVLRVLPGAARPGLVTDDLNYLRAIAAQCANRLDALNREREAIDLQSREALLLQQVTDAELRALRAQINPHFLFNSLNTITDLIVRDPSRAEQMTLRLAGVFRYVLAQSARPLTSIREEIEFVRMYLDIEEARFRDRLHVEIDVAPEIANEPIPSLILQPLVENALRHGLAPKPGPGRLWISAKAEDGVIRLRVEDDGLGPGKGSTGVGLANVAARLRTLYKDRGGVTLEPRENGGCVATVTIPRRT